MQRIRILGAALIAVLALAAIASASASAETLPGFTPPVGGTGTSGAGTLTAEGLSIKCQKDSATFGAATQSSGEGGKVLNLGTVTALFDECKSGGGPCLSLGSTIAEHILFTGEYHMVRGLPGEPLVDYWILLPAGGVHIECEITGLVIVTGNVLGSTTLKSGEKVKTFTITFANANQVQKPNNFLNNKGGTVKTSLISKVGTGKERPAFEATTETVTLNEEVEVLFA